jgi:MOSC domain-containing protein YiiM
VIRLVSVNVGDPVIIGRHRGHPVESGIRKHPVPAGVLHLGRLNLEGDRQADLQVHGGEDKAVYAYASEHFPVWTAGLPETGSWSIGPAAFGENLTTAGVTEIEVGIGDIWGWGDALLQVCQPRWPCYKLTLHSGVGDMASRFRGSGRTGWYLRVLREGDVPVEGPIEVVERDPAGVMVFDAHRAALPSASREEAARVLSAGALAAEWRLMIARRRRA